MKLRTCNIPEIFILSLIFLSTTNSININGENICKNQTYEHNTLELLREQIIVDSFTNSSENHGIPKLPDRFEASDVILRSDGQVFYVVFDNTFQIGAFCTSSDNNCTDKLLDWPDESVHDLESEFEGIAYNSLEDTYFVVQETLPIADNENKFQPNIFEISIGKDDSFPTVQVIESCEVQMEFDSDSKGIEGLEFAVRQETGKIYLLGLCEANKCASFLNETTRERDLGNGRIVVLEKKESSKKNSCMWELVGMINLPASIQFVDYSAISIDRRNSRAFPSYIAITSQENSQVWIGLIEESNELPYFRISSLKKDITYDLPRATELSNKCEIKYCNIEGVAWQSENQLIIVSDKNKNEQRPICEENDQSIHYFALPKSCSQMITQFNSMLQLLIFFFLTNIFYINQ